MGQQVFIPNAASLGDGSRAVFLTQLFDGGDYVNYVSSSADVFYTNQVNFTVCLAFRMVQENTTAETIPLLRVLDSALNGWSFFINPDSKVCASVNDTLFIPDSCDMPLGRVIFAMLTVEVGGGEFFLNGRQMTTEGIVEVPPVAPVTLTLGGAGSWTKDYVEYLGFGYLKRFLPAPINGKDEPAALYVRFQDEGVIAFPSSVASGAEFAVYNASSGLSNLALFSPQQPNTLGAPNLTAVPNGLATGELLEAPLHLSHSGWADAP